MEFYATCPAGFEQLLAQELRPCGIHTARPLQGQVAFTGTLEDGYRACLWSGLASRIVAVIARVKASTADELYESLSQIPWEEHIPTDTRLTIEAHGTTAEIRNTQYLALRTKDALSDRIFSKTGIKIQTDTARPTLRVAIRLQKTHATIGIDLTGEALFKRDYLPKRSAQNTLVPLRPDYARALLDTAGWFHTVRHDNPTLFILFSGAGTIAAEAIRQAQDRASGLDRTAWGFTGWLGHQESVWNALVREAQERAEAGAERTVNLIAFDTRPEAGLALQQSLTRENLQAKPIFFRPQRVAHGLEKALTYAHNLNCVADLSWLDPNAKASCVSTLLQARQIFTYVPSDTGCAVLSAEADLSSIMGNNPTSEQELLQGNQHTELSAYTLHNKPDTKTVRLNDGTTLPAFLDNSQQFSKRLEKVSKARARWAQREDVSCYRVYDADLPDYSASIELYQGLQKGRWLQISEYVAPKGIDQDLAQQRLWDMVTIAPRVLHVSPENTYLKRRKRAKGGSQYVDQAKKTPQRTYYSRKKGILLPEGSHLIDEGGLTFEVNFTNHLDCGIFLDHRDTRAMIREMAKKTKGSKRFLNLFAYTGTATCYAADGDMHHTTSVDMSKPSLAWAKRNMERNGFTGPDHQYIQADVLQWIHEQRRTKNRWDLIFADVPTFSNSSRMHHSWDVQRDHAEFLITLSRLLTHDGICVFSCNLRSFKPDVAALEKADVSIHDITPDTIPDDFARNPRIHHCYLVRHTKR